MIGVTHQIGEKSLTSSSLENLLKGTIVDLRKKLIWQKKESDRKLFQAFEKLELERAGRKEEKRRAGQLKRLFEAEKEKNIRLQKEVGVSKEKINLLQGQEEIARREVQDLKGLVDALNQRIRVLVDEKKILQREVNGIQKLPGLQVRFESLKKEEQEENLRRIGWRIGNGLLHCIPVAMATGFAVVVAGPPALLTAVVLPVAAVAGAAGGKVPEDPKKEERMEEMQEVRLKIARILVGKDFWSKSLEERQKLYEGLKLS